MLKFRPKFRLHRRLAVDSTLFGVMLTLFVAAADLAGLLSPLELWLYDQRALRCQHWTPAPTDRLVHVDIDDDSQTAIGRFPWHRSVVAEIVEEIHLAGAKAIALDLLLSEPQAVEWRPVPGAAESPSGEKLSRRVDHDARLAEAMRRAGNVVVAARLPFRQEEVTKVDAAMRAVLAENPALGVPDVVGALAERGFDGNKVATEVSAGFNSARRAALFERIKAERHDLGREALLKKVLPGLDTSLGSPLLNAFGVEYERAKAVREFRRFALPGDASRPPLFKSELSEAPVEPLASKASGGGFVDYLRSTDGRVRAGPLFMEADGLVYPQFAVALAMRFLGADPVGVRLTKNAAVIPRPGGELVIPVRTVPWSETDGVAAGRDVPMVAAVSWFGGREWTHMYDPAGRETRQHLSIARVWNACKARQKIENNNFIATNRMRAVAARVSDSVLHKLDARLPLGEKPDETIRLIDWVLGEADFQAQSVKEVPPSERDAAGVRFLESLEDLRNVRAQVVQFYEELDGLQRQLRAQLEGRAVLVGWIATASIADFLPSSLHPSCPGVVMHGVIFNQIVTGEVWRTLPDWATLLATVAAGLLTTLAVSILPPPRALGAAALLLAGYLLFNGLVLFDYGNLILGAAGPVVAIGSVWSGGTLAKLLFERVERARITRRFRSYADPKVVDFVLKHPEMNIFEGQVRELTVVYADLVGFTTLTETMGPATVQLLNDLWSALVPVIRRNDALVNKFLGDGAMFFYGAPEQSPHHARDAVRTVLALREELARWNERAAAKGWPPQKMRFGISTGNMVVGDAGAPQQERTDYTVIGDYSNLGARLESANKAVGTTILMTERTVELAGDGFLFRPVGRLCVVGKQTSVMTFEVLARLDDATDEQKQLAAHTKAMVEAFLAGRVKECMEAVGRMEAAHGHTKLAELYRERCAYFLQDPAPSPFDCQIVLSEK